MEIYIATDLVRVGNSEEYNAVYAFKSMTSVRSYEKFCKASGIDHRIVVTPAEVDCGFSTVNVVTEMETSGDMAKYWATKVFENWDDARDHVESVREEQPGIKAEHESVRIHSRFTPGILHTGWAEL